MRIRHRPTTGRMSLRDTQRFGTPELSNVQTPQRVVATQAISAAISRGGRPSVSIAMQKAELFAAANPVSRWFRHQAWEPSAFGRPGILAGNVSSRPTRRTHTS